MRRVLAASALIFLLAAASRSDDSKKDLEQLQGEWSMVSGEIDGQALPEDAVKTAKRISKDNETTVSINGQVFMKAKYTVDSSKKPKAIDYEMTEGATKGKKQLGIYKFDGDTVTFCFSAPDKDRPADFTTAPGSGRVLSVWKREKK
jgi:uncharacterized protein (TIGR03067 family)